MSYRNESWTRWFVPAALAAASLATGCVGSESAGATSGLVEVDSDALPLESVDADEAWRSAPAGCEDRLDVGVSFKVASARDELVAAVNRAGEIVCVDSLDSVQVELEEEGRDEEADELVERFLVTVVCFPDADDLWDDPSPQPSTQIDVGAPVVGKGGMNGGDPSPQPS